MTCDYILFVFHYNIKNANFFIIFLENLILFDRFLRKLADVTRDNMLDESEFAVAVHLIQRRLCGFDIPVSILNTWRPEPRPLLVIRQINEEELQSYGTIFVWLLPNENGIQSRTIFLLIFLLFH